MNKLHDHHVYALRAFELDIEGVDGDYLRKLDEEAPTQEELDEWDQVAAVLAMQFNKVYHGDKPEVVSEDEANATMWTDAVAFVNNAEEMPDKVYRINMFLAGHDIEGPWVEFHAANFGIELQRLARAGVGFSVEFK